MKPVTVKLELLTKGGSGEGKKNRKENEGWKEEQKGRGEGEIQIKLLKSEVSERVLLRKPSLYC